MPKFCIKCQMGDPLPHDERIGQVIYNHLRTESHGTSREAHLENQSELADKLFNITDSDLQRLFIERLWCEKCKRREY